MKSRLQITAIATVLTLLCSPAANAGSRPTDLVIDCKVRMTATDGTHRWLKSTATKSQSGLLLLTKKSSEASKFLFVRKPTWASGSSGTIYHIAPAGRCIGFAKPTDMVKGAYLVTSRCDYLGVSVWYVKNHPSHSTFFRIHGSAGGDDLYLTSLLSMAEGSKMYVNTLLSDSVSGHLQRFETVGCRDAEYRNYRPRGGT